MGAGLYNITPMHRLKNLLNSSQLIVISVIHIGVQFTSLYRVFGRDVTAAILVSQNNEMAAIGVPYESYGTSALFLFKSFPLF